MAIRVSRQTVEALVKGSGEIRVSRQTVEVLAQNLIGDSANSALGLSQSVGLNWSLPFSAENTLELTQDFVYIGPRYASTGSLLEITQYAYVPAIHYVSAESTLSELDATSVSSGDRRLTVESALSLQHFADTIVKTRHEENTLTLSHSATAEKVLTATSQLVLSQVASPGALTVWGASTLDLQQSIRLTPLPQDISTQLALGQTAWSNLKSISESHVLNLTHSAGVIKPIRVSAESPLIWSEQVYNEETYDFDTVWYGLSHSATVNPTLELGNLTYLSFSQTASPGHVKASGTSVSATSTLTLTHSAIVNLTGDGASTLALTQAATGQTGIPVVSTLALTQTAEMIIDRSPSVTTTLGLNQAAAYTLILASTKSQYSPFIGSSTDPNAPTPPSTTIDGPMVGIQVPFQLVYPSVGAVTDAVSLKAPNLGNKDRLSFNRIQRETRGGTLIVFADPDWPQIQTMVLSFSGLLSVEVQALLTFMDDHLGQEIGLIDWEHRYWRGVITSPEEPVIEDRFDSFTASFSFEGELDPLWNPQVVPPTLRYSATRSTQEDGYYVPNEPVLPAVETVYYSAEADSPTKIGSPLYLTGVGHVNLAQADAAGTVQVVGLALEAVSTGFACQYISEGSIERTDWTDVAGTVALSAGATYFLDTSLAGRITSTAPTTGGQYVVRVGRAVNTTTLDIEIELPILL